MACLSACSSGRDSPSIASSKESASPSAAGGTASSGYALGGAVTGLSPGASVVLQNNSADPVTVNANGSFTFPTTLVAGQYYFVTIAAQPSNGQLCSVTSGAIGSITSANVTDVAVMCPSAQFRAPSFTIAEYAMPNLQPGLANMSDGTLWGVSSARSGSTSSWTNSLNQISPPGTVQTVAITSVLATTSEPLAAPIAGPDGALWLSSGGTLARAELTGASNIPFSITGVPTLWPELFDGAGSLWYASSSGAGSVTQAGIAGVTATYTPGVSNMALGRDGSVWFTSYNGNAIGVIAQNGDVTTYPLPSEGNSPLGIALGADGNMWFVEQDGAQHIGVITPSGAITLYTVTGDSGYVLGGSIAVGPDGNMWFTIWSDEVGYITPRGVVTTSTVPTDDAWPSSMNLGPDGRMWFTESSNLAATGKAGAISVSIPTPPNDNFENATVLNGAAGFLYSNDFSATAETGEPSTAGVTPKKTLWWRWTAPSTGTLVLATYGSSYETVVGVYSGTALTNLTTVAAAHVGGPGLTSLSTPVQAGVTYDFVVDGNNGATGVLLFDWRMQ
jgi:virginiamycin B lyase